jgi:ABC-type enterochelin transport system permease subunit
MDLRQLSVFGLFTLFESSKRDDVYNILWALVFGFATLNILSLVSRRFDPNRHRMSFGEMMAVGTVAVAVFLLGWEMLYLFKVFPIRLSAR